MGFPFRALALKSDRASKHLHELNAIEERFFSGARPQIVIDEDCAGGQRLAKLRLQTPVPDEVHILAGELIYQLRSSLDQLAVTLAGMSAARPNPNHVHFPSGDSLRGFEASCHRNLKGFDADLADLIKSTKAYDGGDDTLRAIFKMANIDKHFRLIAASGAGWVTEVRGFHIAKANVGLKLNANLTSLDDGIVISDLGPEGTITPLNADSRIRIDGRFVLQDAQPYDGRPLLEFLADMGKKLDEVCCLVAEHCFKTGRETRPR